MTQVLVTMGLLCARSIKCTIGKISMEWLDADQMYQ